MGTLRTSDELETLKSDLRALRSDLREVAQGVGELARVAAHGIAERPTVADWLRRVARYRHVTAAGRDDALAALRGHGEKSAAAVRHAVQDHPAGAVLAALAVGLAVAWLLTRSRTR